MDPPAAPTQTLAGSGAFATAPPPVAQTLEIPADSQPPLPIPDLGLPLDMLPVEKSVGGERPDLELLDLESPPVTGDGLAVHEKHAVTNAGDGEHPVGDDGAAESVEPLHEATIDLSMYDKPEITDLNIAPFIPGEQSMEDVPTGDNGMAPGALIVGIDALGALDRSEKSSMAEFVAGMDLGMDDDDEGGVELNQGENKKDSDSDGVDCGEGAVSPQRERKKSKYLQPPYLNRFNMRLVKEKYVPPADSMVKEKYVPPADSMAMVLWSPQEEEDKSSLSAMYGSVDVNVMLSELMSTSLDAFHLKWNRSARTVRGFFGEFRSAVYLCNVDLGGDEVHPVDSDYIDAGLAGMEPDEGSKEGKTMRKRIRKKSGADSGDPLNLGSDKTKQGRARQRKKVIKNGADGKSPMNAATGVTNGSTVRSKVGDNGNKGDALLKGKKRKGAAIDETPQYSRYELIGYSADNNLGKNRNTGNAKLNGHQMASASEITNGSKRSTSQLKRKIEETLSGSSAELILSFTPGTIMPSIDELISNFSSYGDLMEPKAEFLGEPYNARVVFARSSDAEKAFNSPERKTAFSSPLASCRLRYLPKNKSASKKLASSPAQPVKNSPVPHMSTPSPAQPVKKSPVPNMPAPSLAQPDKKAPLLYVRKSLERMITRLAKSPSVEKVAESPGSSKLEGMEDLIGDMKAMLEKVDAMLTSPTAATSL